MNSLAGIKKFLYINTYGWIAVASILICAVSGFLLIIPFDILAPYKSVATSIALNPWANLVRNMHYWSAQSFLVFSVLHIYDHLKRSSETNISRKSVWVRLSISLLFIGHVMISGFILKGDSDSQQARRIITTLLESIPFAGPLLSETFIGPAGNWQIIYLQHAATASIILFITIYEHARSIWVNLKTFGVVLLALLMLSLLFRAPLATTFDPLLKGPWYFVGMQEALHWISRPLVIMGVLLAIFGLFISIPYLKLKHRIWIKHILAFFLILYGILTITGFFFRGENWKWQYPWKKDARIKSAFVMHLLKQPSVDATTIPMVMGQPEACLSCHHGMKGLSQSHAESVAGCYSCHLGDPFTLNKNEAHRGMELVPGNLSNASRTCGSSGCHPQIVDRINKSLMSTLSGMIQVDRYVFSETSALDGYSSVHDLRNSAADTHLKNLCAGCHLGNEKKLPGPQAWLQRGGGCNACHLTYRKAALDEWLGKRDPENSGKAPSYHPSIDLSISNNNCKSCHSRSGRISMNYEGWNETSLTRIPEDKEIYQILPDHRIFQFVKADVHHEMGLSCIDCHNSYEIMGDGLQHSHKEQAVSVKCNDCHPAESIPATVTLGETDRETQLIAWLRGYSGNGRIVVTANGTPLVNTRLSKDNQVELTTKLTGKLLRAKKQSGQCYRGRAHRRLSCNACHTSWAPQCIGCHNAYEPSATGFDMVRSKAVRGSWIEYSGVNIAEAPALGVDTRTNTIGTYVPGMILTMDLQSFNKGKPEEVFHRLYAPTSPHTTAKASRTCRSCHNEPLSMGYGRGRLFMDQNDRWIFDSKFEPNTHDNLPEDAWTGFLQDKTGISSTRNGHRPFNLSEQKNILTAGTCLTCHEPGSAVMTQCLSDFSSMKKKRSYKCKVPVW